jgi:hypothetical protein
MYEKHKVLNDIITLEFASALMAKFFGIRLNWVAYAFDVHEKCNSLQVVMRVAKEKNILQSMLLEQACDVTQPMAKSLNVTIGSRFANVFVGGVGKIQVTQTQSSRSSRSQEPPPFGASRLNVMRSIKPKVEPCLGKSTPQSFFKSLSSLRLGKMSKLCSLESISKMSKMLV